MSWRSLCAFENAIDVTCLIDVWVSPNYSCRCGDGKRNQSNEIWDVPERTASRAQAAVRCNVASGQYKHTKQVRGVPAVPDQGGAPGQYQELRCRNPIETKQMTIRPLPQLRYYYNRIRRLGGIKNLTCWLLVASCCMCGDALKRSCQRTEQSWGRINVPFDRPTSQVISETGL